MLRVTTFNDQTYPEPRGRPDEQVEAAGGMDNVNGFVLDLRNNPGGLLTQAIKVSDAFPRRRARSSRPAAATRRTASATTPPRAIWPTASRSSC